MPKLKPVGHKVVPLLLLVKPSSTAPGSPTTSNNKFVSYSPGSRHSSRSLLWDETQSLSTPRFHGHQDLRQPSTYVDGLSFSTYVKGMDYVIDQYLYYTGQKSAASQQVSEELRQIAEKLISRESQRPEALSSPSSWATRPSTT